MAIPALNAEGLLPAGLFDCSLADVRARFGAFQGVDTRQRLFVRLEELVTAMQRSELFEALLLDGSFVSAKPSPNDIDLVAVLRPGLDFERDLPLSEYALISRAMLRRRFGFDIIVAERDSHLYKTYVEFFSLVRENPAARKGLLRLTL
jgi:hypothetical protein